MSCTSVPASSYAWTRTVCLRLRLERSGIRVTSLRTSSGAVCSRSTTGSSGRGDGDPDQAVAAAGDVVGVAGQVADEQVPLPGPRAREPQAYDGARAGLGDADERSSAASATPLAKASPSRTTSTVPSGSRRSSRPVRVSSTKSSFHCSIP